MIHWLRLSVKTDNLQVQHLYPILPSAADRIYIKCTYQTPLSHLWMHWWSPNLPKQASSSLTTSPHHVSFFPLIEMRAQMRRRCKKKITLADIIPTLRPFFYDLPLCVSSIQHTFALSSFEIFLCSFLSLMSLPLHVQARPLSLHVQHRLRDSFPFPCPPSLFSLLFPAKTIGGQDNPLL